MTVGFVVEAVGYTTQLEVGDVLETQDFAGRLGADDDVAKFLGGGEAATIADGILEGLIALLAEGARGSLDVLLLEGCSHVRWHQAILSHYVGLEPHTHRVVGTEAHHITYALHTLEHGDDVDFHVVVEKLLVV